MFGRLHIGARLGAAFASLLLLLCLVAGLGSLQTARINDNVVDMAENWLPSVTTLNAVQGLANEARRASLRHVLSFEPADKARQAARRAGIVDKRMPVALAAYEKTVSSPAEAALFATIKAQWATYIAEDDRLIALSDRGEAGLGDARALSAGAVSVAFNTMTKSVDDDITLNVQGGRDAAAAAATTYRNVLRANLAAVVVAVALGAFLAVQISRSITRPLQQAVKVATTVAAGDLSQQVDARGTDETAQLLQALKSMNDNLAGIVAQVRLGSDGIATGSAQIATGNADLSQRTEEQASNLQQTAASMEQLTGSVKANAETANVANRLATDASGAASRGGVAVGRVVATMNEISVASRRIGDIIGVIDGIAFQTNILALNAAVEAARAGEQGRGFAVVASEVRSLAQRSANAAKEIKTLIGDSVEKVDLGSRQVDEAGKSMTEIVAQVQRVSQLIGEISGASVQQSTGIGQIGDAVGQLDHVTQQNAALVEESAAAAESLSRQAARLAQIVSVFQL